MALSDVVNLDTHRITDADFVDACRQRLDTTGVLVLPAFMTPQALDAIRAEGLAKQDQAYFCAQEHSVYLTPHNPQFASDHPANKKVVSSKGCICDDEIDATSPLRLLYDDPAFRRFVAGVTGQDALHSYADPLSSINLHYAKRGQELGWHFDNSSFAITLLIQRPEAGSRFEYMKDMRDADAGDMNYDGVGDLLTGQRAPDVLAMEQGALVLFRGRNAIHRVSPNESDVMRMLAVLAYNAEPNVALSESARMTFYGRLG